MADKSVSIDLIIKSSEAASSLKEVKQSLKDIKDEMIKAGEGTPAFNKLAAAAGELKDKVDDANDAIKATNPNKFQALASFAASAAGGVSAVTGAMGLFGAQSEEVTKTLAKVQSAMALSTGLASLSEMPKAWASFKTSAVSALNAVKAGIGATGIGLLVIALGTIYAYWDDIKGAVSGVSEEQKKLNKASDENLKTQQKKLDAIGGQDNILKLQGKSEKDILKIKISQTDETIKAAEISILQAEQTKTSQIEASKRNKQILEGIIMFVTAPLQLLMGAIDLAGKAFGQDFGLREGLTSAVAKFVFDPEKVEKDANESIVKAKENLAKLKNDRAGFQLAINAIDKTANDKSKANSDANIKIKEDELKAIAELEQKYANETIKLEQDEEIRNAKTAQDKLKILYERNQDELKAQLLANKDNVVIKSELQQQLILLQRAFNDELAALNLTDATTEVSSTIQGSGADKIRFVVYKDGHTASFSLAEEGILEAKAIRKKEFTDKLELALKLNEGLQSLSDMAFTIKMHNTKKGTAEEEKALRAQFKINKALQLSSVIIQGILAAQTAYAAGVAAGLATTAGVSSLPLGAIYAGVSIAGTLAAIAKISATQFDTTSVSGGVGGGGGGGGGDLNAGAATATSNSQPSTLLNPDGTVSNQNTPTPTPIQVYVVESDITSTQTQVAVVQNQMNFQ